MSPVKTARILILCLPFFASLSFAGGKGTTAVPFLKGGAGARASGMAEAYAALADDASAVYWNPAALALLQARSVLLAHAASMGSTAYSYGAYGQKVNALWGIGLGVQHASEGSLEGRDPSGFPIAGFSPTDTAFSLGAARRLGPVSAGVAAKFVQSKIVDSASAFAGDAGLLWSGLGGGKVSAALTAANLGGKITYDTVEEDLPSSYRLAFGFHPSSRWTLGLDVVSPADNDAYGAIGVESLLARNDRFSLSARAGYSTRSSGEAGSLSGAAVGLGFGLNGLVVDYAFLPMGDLGQSHRVSLSYAF